MFCDPVKEKINVVITNNNFNKDKYHNIEIANHHLYAYPNRKYHYDVDLKDLVANTYIMNGKPVTGVFSNITFTKGSFFDCSIFRRVIFKNCKFEDVHIRWCKFEKCEFINCEGNINYLRGGTIKSDCIFLNTFISVNKIDQYTWFNSQRYTSSFTLK